MTQPHEHEVLFALVWEMRVPYTKSLGPVFQFLTFSLGFWNFPIGTMSSLKHRIQVFPWASFTHLTHRA